MKKILLITILSFLPAWVFSQAVTLDPTASSSEIKLEKEVGSLGVLTARVGIRNIPLASAVLSTNNFPIILSTGGTGTNNYNVKINPGGDIGVGHRINNTPWNNNINSSLNLIKAKLHVEGVTSRDDGIYFTNGSTQYKTSIYGNARTNSSFTANQYLVGILGTTSGITGKDGRLIGVMGVGSESEEPDNSVYNFYSTGKVINNLGLTGYQNELRHEGIGYLIGSSTNVIAMQGNVTGLQTTINSHANGKEIYGQRVSVYGLGQGGNLVNYLGLTEDNVNFVGNTIGISSEVRVKSTKAIALTYPLQYYSGYGVKAKASGDTKADKYGIHGVAEGSQGEKIGVYGAAFGGGTNYAGYFEGDVTVTGHLNVQGSLSKPSGTFKIDHPQDPENKFLYHSFVESPDMMNIYNGNVMTDENGVAIVELPGYFTSLNKDFRYQLTNMGGWTETWIEEKVNSQNQFVIKTKKPNSEVSWQVTGIRNDPYAEQNRVVPEVDKPEHEKGTYLYPQGYQKL